MGICLSTQNNDKQHATARGAAASQLPETKPTVAIPPPSAGDSFVGADVHSKSAPSKDSAVTTAAAPAPPKCAAVAPRARGAVPTRSTYQRSSTPNPIKSSSRHASSSNDYLTNGLAVGSIWGVGGTYNAESTPLCESHHHTSYNAESNYTPGYNAESNYTSSYNAESNYSSYTSESSSSSYSSESFSCGF